MVLFQQLVCFAHLRKGGQVLAEFEVCQGPLQAHIGLHKAVVWRVWVALLYGGEAFRFLAFEPVESAFVFADVHGEAVGVIFEMVRDEIAGVFGFDLRHHYTCFSEAQMGGEFVGTSCRRGDFVTERRRCE